MRHGDARLLAVQAASYFSPGFVPMQELTVHETGWTLLGQQVKGYYGPVAASDLPPISQEEISPWYLLPHHKRPLTHEQKHEIRVDVWTLRFRSEGPLDCMTQILFVFGREGKFTCGEYKLVNGALPLSLKRLWCTLSRTGVNWNDKRLDGCKGGKDTHVCPFKIAKLSYKRVCFYRISCMLSDQHSMDH
ncbi:hypothetical protein [Paenibacillus terrae]|uniref:hypothetical protein n=1 Tax=Paenibacillus terrae TaxID=159743 RepID=UPI00207B1B68|nr:hypothetical protein [Paenibacillus terrae]